MELRIVDKQARVSHSFGVLIEVDSVNRGWIVAIAETEGFGNWRLQKDSFHQVQQVFNWHNYFLDLFTEMNAYTYIHMTFFTLFEASP